MNQMIFDAIIFATNKHHGQLRKYTGEPYIVHPLAVAKLVSSCLNVTTDMIIASIFHDLKEDTDVSLKEIETRFGKRVAELVEMLTDFSKPKDGNRAERKMIDREHTAKAHPDAKTIKLADLIDNTKSIVEHAPDFAKVYLEEKRLLLEVLKEGDSRLLEIAYKQISV